MAAQLLALAVIGLAVFLIVRKLDVRLVLTVAALLLGALGGNIAGVTSRFLALLADETFVLPICTAMGFAYVLRETQCDRHLVQLLVGPLRHIGSLLIPGTVLIGFLTNIPIVSQAGAASAVGPVLIPLLSAARISPVTSGAALLLGCSMGGELFNPSAPELRAVVDQLKDVQHVDSREIVAACVRPVLLQLLVAGGLFWWWSLGHERLYRERLPTERPDPGEQTPGEQNPGEAPFRVNYFKAMIPVVPLALLFLTGKPLELIPIDARFLVGPTEPGVKPETRLVAAAMLFGALLAAATRPMQAGASSRAFWDGAGHAYATVISIIVAATAFGEGVKAVRFDAAVHEAISNYPGLLIPLAIAGAALFAWVCGSGIAATKSLFSFFVKPAQSLGVDLVQTGAIVSLASAAGRTMSPVAAVTIVCSSLTNTQPLDLVRRVVPPLVTGLIVVGLFRVFVPGW